MRREVRHHGAEAQLAADQGAMVAQQFRRERVAPEPVGMHLAGEVRVFRVLPAQDLRPLQRECAAHVAELVARTGKNESDAAS